MNAGGNSSKLLQQMGSHQGGMAAGAASQDLNALHTLEQAALNGQGHQRVIGAALWQMAQQPTRGGFGLLVDLLEHEVAEAALVRHVVGALQLGGRSLLPLTGFVVELNAQRPQQGHFPILQRQDGASHTCQRRGVAGAKKFAFTKTNQQGRLPASHHQGIRAAGPDHSQGVGTIQLRQGLLDRLEQRRAIGR